MKKLIPSLSVPDPETLRSLFGKRNSDPGTGGGGGGDRNPIPVTVGILPKFTTAIQIVPPSVRSNLNAVVELPPTLLGTVQPLLLNKDLLAWGDPNANGATNSNGPGKNGGMGNGNNRGILFL